MSFRNKLIPYGLILLSLTGISSCRFGNYEQDAPGPGAIDGYYETLINPTIVLCLTQPETAANGSTVDVTTCPTLPATHVDGNIASIMTNPVLLQFDSTSGFFGLFPNNDPNSSEFIPLIGAQGSNQLGYSGAWLNYGVTPMSDSNRACSFPIYINANAQYTTTGPYNSGTDLPLSGRIIMNLTWDYVQNNDPSCATLSDCYNDATTCSAGDQQVVQALFQPFVAAGVVTVPNISKVEKLEYQVSYQ